MQGLKRSCTDALDAAVRTRQRSEYQQQNQRKGELGTSQHWLQFSLCRQFRVDAHDTGRHDTGAKARRGRGGCRLFSVRQLAVAVQQLHRREEEQPKADQRGQDAQRKHGGPAMVDATAG